MRIVFVAACIAAVSVSIKTHNPHSLSQIEAEAKWGAKALAALKSGWSKAQSKAADVVKDLPKLTPEMKTAMINGGLNAGAATAMIASGNPVGFFNLGKEALAAAKGGKKVFDQWKAAR